MVRVKYGNCCNALVALKIEHGIQKGNERLRAAFVTKYFAKSNIVFYIYKFHEERKDTTLRSYLVSLYLGNAIFALHPPRLPASNNSPYQHLFAGRDCCFMGVDSFFSLCYRLFLGK